jgi:hypothetical protein
MLEGMLALLCFASTAHNHRNHWTSTNRCAQSAAAISLNPLLCSVLGAVTIIAGLYVVLWGKAEDANGGQVGSKQTADADGIAVTVDTPTNLSEPLLPTVAEPVF